MSRTVRSIWYSLRMVLIAGLLELSGASLLHQNDCRADDPVDYLKQVKPILAHHCFACHGALQQRSGLRLDTVNFMFKGGQAGPVIEPGRPTESLMLDAVTGGGGIRKMPPEGDGTPLTAEQIDILKRWIAQGAKGPADEPAQVDPRSYWSYQIPLKPAVPAVKNTGWVINPVDSFIAATHEKRGLQPSPAADKATWLRRVTLDLIGLPPTRDEYLAFLADQSPDASEKVVDGLLDRPQYGERWGRHWMDVWRYSDWYGSRGINEIRYSQRHIWRWRDWIVEALNRDAGYDQMVVEMLAGDELAPTDPNILRATGFLGRNWYKFDRNVWMFDTVEHTSQAFLGLTLKCCRCHDHKYDPISQEDYYRFRAFFEPHDVRTDRVSATAETEKDATLGMVLKDGVARIYDKNLEAKTFLFIRGDNRQPDEKHPLTPAVPVVLTPTVTTAQLDVKPITLPIEAYYPALQPAISQSLILQAQAKVDTAAQNVTKAKATLASAEQKVAEHAKSTTSQSSPATADPVIFQDDFKQARPDVWQILSGEWKYEDGHLVQKSVGGFLTMASKTKLPTDFRARLRYRVLEPGTLRSIGFSFDYQDAGNSQDVYTHVNADSQGIQAFHRSGGNQAYPEAGIVKTPGVIRVGEIITVEIVAHGQNLTLSLNGERKLDYLMPIARRAGTFALWCHLGSAEFHELEIRELLPSLLELQRAVQLARQSVELAERQSITAAAEVDSIKSRVTAERAKYTATTDAAEKMRLALEAGRSERLVALRRADEAVLQAEQHLANLQQSMTQTNGTGPATGAGTANPAAASPSPMPAAAIADAEKKLALARQSHATAQAAVDQPNEMYTALGDQFPSTTSGRRLALARWMTHPQHPRTARVAVNHIWLRHFGQALVPTVANFGLNGDSPSHPELLDWLAVELVEQNWRMKPIHRMLVLSNTYRQASTAGAADHPNRKLDLNNRYLWRMNPRRMEAEVVRDSVLALAGSLDLRQGGPEIPEAEGQTTLRRSLYFRSTPNEKMKFLEVFDAADPNACYRRQSSVVPNQALALMNSSLALDQARLLAEKISRSAGEKPEPASNRAFIQAAFEHILTQPATEAEVAVCQRFLESNTTLVQDAKQSVFPAGGTSKRPPSTQPHQRARENLIHVLLSHNSFVTIR